LGMFGDHTCDFPQETSSELLQSIKKHGEQSG